MLVVPTRLVALVGVSPLADLISQSKKKIYVTLPKGSDLVQHKKKEKVVLNTPSMC